MSDIEAVSSVSDGERSTKPLLGGMRTNFCLPRKSWTTFPLTCRLMATFRRQTKLGPTNCTPAKLRPDLFKQRV